MRIDEKLALDDQLYGMLVLMSERADKNWDNLLLVDGDEGGGKSTIGTQLSYSMSKITGRNYSVDNIFFSVEKAIEFASKTEKQIIHIDESVFDLLASEYWNPMQNLLIKLLMTARKKNHFVLLLIPKFFMLRQYLVDRAIGLVHIYSPDNLKRGYFAYYKKANKNYVYEQWKKKKTSSGLYTKNYSFLGRFPKTFETLIDSFAYEKKKDEAIANLTSTDKTKSNPQMIKIQTENEALKRSIIFNVPGTLKEKSNWLNISQRTILRWKSKLNGGESYKTDDMATHII